MRYSHYNSGRLLKVICTMIVTASAWDSHGSAKQTAYCTNISPRPILLIIMRTQSMNILYRLLTVTSIATWSLTSGRCYRPCRSSSRDLGLILSNGDLLVSMTFIAWTVNILKYTFKRWIHDKSELPGPNRRHNPLRSASRYWNSQWNVDRPLFLSFAGIVQGYIEGLICDLALTFWFWEFGTLNSSSLLAIDNMFARHNSRVPPIATGSIRYKRRFIAMSEGKIQVSVLAVATHVSERNPGHSACI